MTRTTYQPGPEIGHYHDGLGPDLITFEEALANLDLPAPVIEQFVTNIAQNETFVTELVTNEEYVTQLVTQIFEGDEADTYITQLTENATYLANYLTEITNLTEISQNNTYITNLVTQINAKINAKKGIASELATLDSGSKLTSSQIPTKLTKRAVEFVIDGGGSAIATGVKGDIEVPFAWTDIESVRLLADQSGSIVVNVWKDTYANFPPTVGDKITASAPPTISSATKSQDSTLTGWTKTGSAGDILRFNVDSVTTITRVTVSIILVI